MRDYLLRGVTKVGNMRGIACVTTDLVNETCRRHKLSITAAVALGRALSGGALLSALLKDDQRLALKFEGNGPLKKIMVEADSSGGMRGCVGDPTVELPPVDGRVDVAGALGRAGFLTVIKDIGLKSPYQGQVQLFSSEIGEDLACYFAESEQIPSAVGVVAIPAADGTIAVAGGFLVQSLPPADELLIDGMVERINGMAPLSSFLEQESGPEALLAALFADTPLSGLTKQDLEFRCTCSREKVKKALTAMSREELATIIAEEGEVEVICEFCKARYGFSSI
ncbi:MAG: Hsp33 family molecular chaperone HslO [Desulfobulbaceae bacterium]|nr:Hsp33 family molecular chaperone HslO [Desulfobulbaceae bacterium]